MRTKALIIASAVAGILLIAGAWSFYSVFIKAPAELAHATANGIQEFFNFTPRVKIDQIIVIEQNAPIMEVATVSRQLIVDYTWAHTWLGSTKTIHLIGSFTAKAGFDLKEPFTIEIEKSPLHVKASLPPPRILSITMDSFRIAADESGWWNRISTADREAGVENLQSTARTQAESSGMLDEARTSVEQRIKDIVQQNGSTVEFTPPAPGE